ncbi:MAG TPA: nitrous oxide reductase accessory protein NosL, partial [Gemmatimonadaceae bacterium]|nr:nitrous oxide reductase accessory protein NosL [Gemmatimonadaceae bacterium]
MPKSARALLALAAVLLLGVFVFPIWRIGLVAPQYPEGLGMTIHVNTIRGATEFDLENINNLNHYIGMKRIEPDAIPELALMPWIVGGLVAGALAVAAAGRRKLLYAYTGLFALVGVAGLVDFWLWEYDYGHNLDEATAIIKIPGMTYQPPLIGSKQLLNFVATSWPDVGGVAAGLAFLCAAGAVFLTLRSTRARQAGRVAAAAALAVAATACAPSGPAPIQYGSAECAECHMMVSDARFGAQLVTGTGKTLTFDSVECLAGWYLDQQDATEVRSLWVTDFRHPGTFVPATEARFVRGTQHSPMGLGIVAFAADADPAVLAREFGGATLDWAAVLEAVRRDGAPHA